MQIPPRGPEPPAQNKQSCCVSRQPRPQLPPAAAASPGGAGPGGRGDGAAATALQRWSRPTLCIRQVAALGAKEPGRAQQEICVGFGAQRQIRVGFGVQWWIRVGFGAQQWIWAGFGAQWCSRVGFGAQWQIRVGFGVQ
uniref:Uncharacterized protein n=1 Tax=Nothoprocta perdicaria TaxID=30464 RepID=A0A8C6ZTI1_NOTPE